MKDHEGMNVAYQLKQCVSWLLQNAILMQQKLQLTCQFLWD